jgi:hypothetical protein
MNDFPDRLLQEAFNVFKVAAGQLVSSTCLAHRSLRAGWLYRVWNVSRRRHIDLRDGVNSVDGPEGLPEQFFVVEFVEGSRRRIPDDEESLWWRAEFLNAPRNIIRIPAQGLEVPDAFKVALQAFCPIGWDVRRFHRHLSLGVR